MAIRDILEGSNPRLRRVARPVREISDHIRDIVDDMIETLANAEGVGLAAPQVGINRRIVVIRIGDAEPLVLINPEIVSAEGSEQRLEGCLSFPGQWGEVVRPERVTVKALDRDGGERTYTGEGLLAQAFAHEVDHLDGVLFVDKVVSWVSEDDLRSEEEEGARE